MDKAPDAFRTISEVAELLETPAHVLRFWESRFPQIKPVKRAGGRRYYRPADMALLSGIRRLLHEEGMTIRGVQKILREQGVRHVSGLTEEEDAALEMIEDVEETLTSSAPIPLFPQAHAEEDAAEPEAVALDAPDENAAILDDQQPQDPALPSDAAVPLTAKADDLSDDAAQDAGPDAPEHEAGDEGDIEANDPIADDHAAADPVLADQITDAPIAAPLDDVAEAVPPAAVKNIFVDHPQLPLDLPPLARPAPAKPVAAQPVAAAPQTVAEEVVLDAQADPEQSIADSDDDAPDEAIEAPMDERDTAPPEGRAAPEPDRPNQPAAALDAGDDVQAVENTAPAPVPPQPAADPVPTAAQASTAPESAPESAPDTPPDSAPIPAAHWLAADLRALRRDGFVGHLPQATALVQRLEALRDRVGDRGRVPRR